MYNNYFLKDINFKTITTKHNLNISQLLLDIKNNKPIVLYYWLKYWYIKLGRSIPELTLLFGLSYIDIVKLLNVYNIKKYKRGKPKKLFKSKEQKKKYIKYKKYRASEAKTKETLKKKYNTDSYSKTEEFKKRVKYSNRKYFGKNYTDFGKTILLEEDKFKEFMHNNKYVYTPKELAELCNTSARTIYRFAKITNTLRFFVKKSYIENRIYKQLVSRGYNVEYNVRFFVDKDVYKQKYIEVDIYLPDYKIGIELNAFYTHSVYSSKQVNLSKQEKLELEKDYHYKRTTFFNEEDIILLQFTEDNFKIAIEHIENVINNRVNINENILLRDLYPESLLKKLGYRDYKVYKSIYCLKNNKVNLFKIEDYKNIPISYSDYDYVIYNAGLIEVQRV